MKTIDTTIKTLLAISVFAIVFLFTACSEDNNIMNGSSNTTHYQTDNPDSNVTVEPSWQEGGWLIFKVTNNLQVIVNDFHVQFDTTVKITNVTTVNDWVVDPTSTDTAKGKIGVKCGQNSQPIYPGHFMNAVGVKLKFTGVSKKNPRQWWDYTWQATRNGVVVFQGQGAFPPR